MTRWKSDDYDERLRLPGLNEYIPTDFSLRGKASGEEDDDVGPEIPPKLVVDTPQLRLWHKLDRYWQIPKSFIRLALLSPDVYRSPRTMTLNRIFQKVLNDDLNSFVYDASLAGCGYRVSCAPNGYRITVRGYSEKLPFLLDTLTARILSLIDEMKVGDPALQKSFDRARESLLRETKNYRLDPPYEVANYNSRLLIEENVWYLDNYVDVMEGSEHEVSPLTMTECAEAARLSVSGRVKCEALCMGNIDEGGAEEVRQLIEDRFLSKACVLGEAETPRFRSLKLPTPEESSRIFGDAIPDGRVPMIYQDIAFSESEENNAVELILQAGSELDLGYEGIAILDLITHIAYTSAFNQLRTKEQLGYIVSVFARKTAGSAWGMSLLVQSSVALPAVLEERCEAWLAQFRQELESLPASTIADEASAVIAQLLESETKMSQEAGRVWGEILNTEGMTDRMRTPAFDRLDRLVSELEVSEPTEDESESADEPSRTAEDLKASLLSFFDQHFAATSPSRRAMSSRVFNHKARSEYEQSSTEPGVLTSFGDMRHVKQYLSSWPTVPYWRTTEN